MAQQPDYGVKHHFSSGVYIKSMSLDVGNTVETHSHLYEHFGILTSGVAGVTIDGIETVYAAPQIIVIAAGKKHQIRALTGIDWLCVHATEETDPGKVDRVLIKGV